MAGAVITLSAIVIEMKVSKARWMLALLLASACSKTETVPFDLNLPGNRGDYRYELELGSCSGDMDALEVEARGSWPEITLEEGQLLGVRARRESDCTGIDACYRFEGGTLVEETTMTVTCADVCCAGICQDQECMDAGVPPDVEVPDSNSDASDSGPTDAGDDTSDVPSDMNVGPTPLQLEDLTMCTSVDATEVATGTAFSCALSSTGDVYCWGNNQHGQANPNAATTMVGVEAVAGLGEIQQIGAGDEHACARSTDAVHCWGNNDGQQARLGVATGSGPSSLFDVGTSVSDLSVGLWHTCGVLGDRPFCWGQNASGELGIGDGTTTAPTMVGGSHSATRMLAGVGNSCIVAPALRCWGYNAFGAVGPTGMGTSNVASPTELVGREAAVPDLMATSHTRANEDCATSMEPRPYLAGVTCARLDEELACWGDAQCGLTPPTTTDDSAIRLVDHVGGADISAMRHLALGGGTACASFERSEPSGTHDLYCWGQGGNNMLFGTPTRMGPENAVQLLQGVPIRDLDIGTDHMCVVAEVGGLGRVYCWGSNANGKALPGGNPTDSYATPQCVSVTAE